MTLIRRKRAIEKKPMRLRRWLVAALAAIGLFIAVPLAWAAATSQVTTTDVNMRSGPSMSASVVRVVKGGTTLNVIGQEGNWYKIEFDGKQGYVHSNNVRSLVGTTPQAGQQPSTAVTGTYKLGSQGESVRQIQQQLKDAGYFSVMPTGLFSSITHQSVLNFQRDKGLKVDGIVGPQTLAALFAPATGTGEEDAGDSGTPSSGSGQATAPAGVFRRGQTSEGVRQIQQKLKSAGYFTVEPTGFFGVMTYNAVISFQRDKGLKVDGVVGPQTLGVLFANEEAPVPPDESSPPAPGAGLLIEEVKWGDAQTLFKVGMVCEVIDVRTGKSFNALRIGGRLHADFGPATAADTQKFNDIVGTYSWERRPVLLKVAGRTLAASINCMPHDVSYISGNNMVGMLCMHFRDSRTHASNAVCPLHQTAITQALNYGK